MPRPLATPWTIIRENCGFPVAALDAEEVGEAAAAALLVRRDAYRAAKGFDERFFPGWYEDVDFCRSLRARAGKFALNARRDSFTKADTALALSAPRILQLPTIAICVVTSKSISGQVLLVPAFDCGGNGSPACCQAVPRGRVLEGDRRSSWRMEKVAVNLFQTAGRRSRLRIRTLSPSG
jgi:hypothetical protein